MDIEDVPKLPKIVIPKDQAESGFQLLRSFKALGVNYLVKIRFD